MRSSLHYLQRGDASLSQAVPQLRQMMRYLNREKGRHQRAAPQLHTARVFTRSHTVGFSFL